MKTNAIVRIVLYSILIVLLAGILLSGIYLNELSFQIVTGSALDRVLSEGPTSFDAERVSKIDIDWAAGSIRLAAGEPRGAEGDITMMPSTTDEKYPITFEIEGDTLKIAYTNTTVGIQIGSIPEKDLTIWVPKRWFCDNLEIDGAALELIVENVKLGSLDIDGAACVVSLEGTVETVDCDGAACVLDLKCNNAPSSIDLDGVSCELNLTLPEDCGFLVQMNGLSSTFHSSLSYTVADRKYIYGDQQCRIDTDGLSCEISINTAQS